MSPPAPYCRPGLTHPRSPVPHDTAASDFPNLCALRYGDDLKRKRTTQYHEVMEAATYKWLGVFSRIVVIIALASATRLNRPCAFLGSW